MMKRDVKGDSHVQAYPHIVPSTAAFGVGDTDKFQQQVHPSLAGFCEDIQEQLAQQTSLAAAGVLIPSSLKTVHDSGAPPSARSPSHNKLRGSTHPGSSNLFETMEPKQIPQKQPLVKIKASISPAVSSAHQSMAYNNKLIQQGLIPNPAYNLSASLHSSFHDHELSHATAGGKRKLNIADGVVLDSKKRQTEQANASITHPISSAPKTTFSSHPSLPPHTGSIPGVLPQADFHGTSLRDNLYTSASQAGPNRPPAQDNMLSSKSHSGFINSFKSFLENGTPSPETLQTVKKPKQPRQPRYRTNQGQTISVLDSSVAVLANKNSPTQKSDRYKEQLSGISSSQQAVHSTLPCSNSQSCNNQARNKEISPSNHVLDKACASPVHCVSESQLHDDPDLNSSLLKDDGNVGSNLAHPLKKTWLQRHDKDEKTAPSPIARQKNSSPGLPGNGGNHGFAELKSDLLAANGRQHSVLLGGSVGNCLPHGSNQVVDHSNNQLSIPACTLQIQDQLHKTSENSATGLQSSTQSQNKNSNIVLATKMPSSHSMTETGEIKSLPFASQNKDITSNIPQKKDNLSDSQEYTDSKAADESDSSKSKKENSTFTKPLVNMSVSTLKKTLLPFLQDGPCTEIAPKLNKCRECKMVRGFRSKEQAHIFCRFYAFRRLKYDSNGLVTIHGFSELAEADPDDIEPWLPQFPIQDPQLDVENSKFIIAKVGDKFCELVEQEKEARSWAGQQASIIWKRAVAGVREMCDVCDTTLFNIHWVCPSCGFVACVDCFKVRRQENQETCSDKWLTCSSNKQVHRTMEMMLTQIIPSDALWELGRQIHDIRIKWQILSNCPCGGSRLEKTPMTSLSNQTPKVASPQSSNVSSPLSILAEAASMESNSSKTPASGGAMLKPAPAETEETEKKGACLSLRELLAKTAGKPKGVIEKKVKKGNSSLSTLDNIIQSVVEKSCSDGAAPFKFLHYTPRLGGWRREMPIMVHSLTETSVLYPDVPHSWLCDGRLLRLHDAHHKGNLQIFQEQWKRGQPVLVSCSNKGMNSHIWKPEVFLREFGHVENEVVNCRTGDVIIGHTMGDFWAGFESLRSRPRDKYGEPMLLKLKDWPPGDDFSELLPTRFQDLMSALPLPEYTHRDGKLNLASRLPEFLVRPDLGPKMYNAYGSSYFPKEGTTNLHLDISDAVNVMVYVGIPGDGHGGRRAQEEAAVRAIDNAGCDSITKKRVREVHEIPGALWHIYDAHDADKIRDFLNKVAKERGEIIEKDHDAIHDQSWYLDKGLCDRLYQEYGVQGYTIIQCLGDAVFIPAGAPHQVRNLHSCIKVAEDFVSPEHLNHCFRLTQEFRQLSETHSNHEDKLQVKNIIYHAVKDAVAVLNENNPDDEQ